MAHFAAASMPFPLGGMKPSKIASTEFSSVAIGEVVPVIWPCCLSHVYAEEALLACPWQLWQVVEKPSVFQIEDQVGAVPEEGGHPVLTVLLEIELALLLEMELLPEFELRLVEERPLPSLLEPTPTSEPVLSELLLEPRPPPLFELELLLVEPANAGVRTTPPLLLVELERLDWLSVGFAPASIPSTGPPSSKVGGSVFSTRHPASGMQPTIATR
jgi:hypothetical protein